MLSRMSTRRLLAQNAQSINRRAYANTPEELQSASRVPLILGGIGLAGVAAGAGYFVFAPPERKEHDREAIWNVKENIKNGKPSHSEISKKLDQARAPKDNVSKDSEAGHRKMSLTNEHKVREGVFCEKEFDNHDTKHSSNPAKDFEAIKKGR